jgi:anthranilate phosphoribosyltransferase
MSPDEFGLPMGKREDLAGGTPAQNAAVIRSILNGEKGARRNAVLMNAGSALYIAGKADNISRGIDLAAEIIDDGAAAAVLDEFIKASNG